MEDKLKAEYEAIKGEVDQAPVEAVLNHLMEAGKNNPALEEKIMEESKTLKDCCKYIYEAVKASVKNKSGTTCVCKTPEEVYALAEKYYFKEPKAVSEAKEEVEPEAELEEEPEIKEYKETESVSVDDPLPVVKPLEDKTKRATPPSEEKVAEATVKPTKKESGLDQISLF